MSPAASLQNWLGVIFTVLSLAGMAVLFWLALRRPPVRRPSCGKCGYAVEGLEVLSCPECGSDLREVGIETPKRKMLHPGLFVLFWSLLLIIPFATAFTFAMRAGPRVIIADATFGLTSTSGAMPQLHIQQRIEALAVGEGVFVSSASIESLAEDGVTTTTIRFPTIAGARLRESEVDVRTAVDAVQAVEPRLILVMDDGVEVDTERLAPVFGKTPDDFRDDGAEVAALLNALMDGKTAFPSSRLRLAGNNMVTTRSVTPPWYVPILVVVGGAIYGLGIIVYFVLRKRRLARASA